MIAFLVRKMWKNKWMMLSLLIGNILLVGVVAGTPLYTQATMQRILQKDLQQYQISRNAHPAIAELKYTFNYVKPEKILPAYLDTRDRIVPEIVRSLDIPIFSTVQNLSMENWYCSPVENREDRPRTRSITLTNFDGYEEHINLTQGRLPSDTLVDGNIIECLANENTMIRQDLLLNELLSVANVDGDEEQLYIRVVGIFETKEEQELYWTVNPNTFNSILMMSGTLLRDRFLDNYIPEYRITSRWIMLLDYTKMNAAAVPYYQQTDALLKARFNTADHVWDYKENFISTVQGYALRTEKLTVTLWVLQVPIYVLLAFYIYMVSRQILMLEQNDISVLKSRGASRGQLLGLYTMQSIFVAAVSLLAGIPLGMSICRMLGASNGFLDMVRRSALPVTLNQDAFLYAGVAVLLSMLTMLAPVVRFSRVTIVDYKRGKSGKPKKSLWQRFYLDVLCFGIACYGLYSFQSNREIMARVFTEVQSVDPLLYASASLFIIGLGLLCLRVFPYLMRLVFVVGKKLWPPSLYASLLKVVRSAGEEQFIMIFLVFTLAVGIFDAKAARTINLNSDHKIQYQTGADLVIAEIWRDNQPTDSATQGDPAGAPDAPKQVVYYEPDFERFTRFEEVDAAAKVLKRDISVRKVGSTVDKATLMGIDTHAFGEVLWYRDDLLPAHINYYLNVLAKRSDGVLLSENFKTKYEYEVGDVITYRDGAGNEARGIVYGFVTYWPGYSSVVTVDDKSGEKVQQDKFLVVANLGYLQTTWGLLPYQVWMKTNVATNRFFNEFATENKLRLSVFDDAKASVIESKSDPILQGTNGVLTVGFIATLLVCFTGFLIYWILSIKSRVLQFGIFRAMGMSMRQIIGLLVNEQLFITLTAVAIGAAVGEISSRLFVPLIQISFSASEQIIPLQIITEGRDYANLFATIGVMIAVCLFVLGVIISRIKIAQALKLGED